RRRVFPDERNRRRSERRSHSRSIVQGSEPVESQRASMLRWRRALGFLVRTSLIAAAIAAVVIGGALGYMTYWAETPLMVAEPVGVELLPGETLAGFAAELKSAGVVQSDALFTAYARWKGAASRIQAGEYRVQPGETPDKLLADLVAGAVATYDIRIVEGSTV